jgi:uncharacterized protein (TIGR03118 family)
MINHSSKLGIASSIALSALVFVGCGGSGGGNSASSTSAVIELPGFSTTNLVSDQSGVAAITDPNLVNPWGIAFSPAGPFWLADNNSNLATVYTGGNVGGAITNDNLNVTIPFGNPSGEVYNGTSDFQVTNGTTTAPALFIFCSETGWIDGWNPQVASSTAEAPIVVQGAVYKGLAIGSNATGNFLFATNFAKGTIDVFDKTLSLTTLSGSFSDPSIPSGFAPFGIQNLGGTLYVTYAKQDSAKHDDTKGPGNGYIDTFDTNGNFLSRIAGKGVLNSPWGLTMAPASFGAAANLLLVGNFGDGRVNVFNPTTNAYVGTLAASNGQPIVVPGLWGLAFGNGGSAGDTTSLYFTSGPSSENHGLFGRINTAAGPVKKL